MTKIPSLALKPHFIFIDEKNALVYVKKGERISVKLSNRNLAIIKVFYKHRGKLILRAELFRAIESIVISEMHPQTQTDMIVNQVYELREMLRTSGIPYKIETGQLGYVFKRIAEEPVRYDNVIPFPLLKKQ